MAAAPKYKVYDAHGEYIGCVKYLEDAAVLVGICGRGAGAKVKAHHTLVLWTEGIDGEAADSYDEAASIMGQRERLANRDRYLQQYGVLPEDDRKGTL